MKVYFYKYNQTKNLSQYKRTWIEQIYNGIEKYSDKIKIVNEITETDIIFTIGDYVKTIETEYNIAEKGIKLIVLSCQDPIMINKDIITNPNVIYIFDHLKLLQVPDNFCLLNNTYSYSQYLLNKYYNSDKLDNLNFLTNIDIEFKKQYMEKTKCILNTSKIYSRIFEISSSKIHERKYDIAFVGTTNYGEGTNTTLHRTDLIPKLKEISAKHNIKLYLGESGNGDKIPLHKFHRILKNTKIFISPWGYGEWSLKEFECICFGTHCIIPNKHLSNYPDYYSNFDEYLLDFTNLEDVILYSLNNLDIIQEKIDKNKKLFSEYSNEKQIKQIEELICC
jgi:hypothetical protein